MPNAETIAGSFSITKPLPEAERSLLSVLNEIADDCAEPNWNGDGALPVLASSLENAKGFVRALPNGMTMPGAGVEADGHLTLEWHLNPRWTLSVSVAPDGMLYYAALFGSGQIGGRAPFEGSVPTELLNLIRQVGI